MSLNKKTTLWVQNGFITPEQQEKILQFEKTNSNHTFWNTAFIIAGILIGLGICLLIAANWQAIPATLKLTGDFALLGALFYATYWSIQNQRKGLKELFAILSFLGIAGTFGLVGQVFQLPGSWHKFAFSWAILGAPFILISRSRFINMIWLYLLISALPIEWLSQFGQLFEEFTLFHVLIFALIYILHLGALEADKAVHKYTICVHELAQILLWLVYIYVGFVAVTQGLMKTNGWGYAVVFGFLLFRMLMAVRQQNIGSFKQNAMLLEIYVFMIFAFKMGSLWMSGMGLITGGMLILALIWLLRKTTRYIKQMEVFQ